MSKVYLVIEENGSYSDYTMTILEAFSSFKLAKNYISLLEAFEKACKETYSVARDKFPDIPNLVKKEYPSKLRNIQLKGLTKDQWTDKEIQIHKDWIKYCSDFQKESLLRSEKMSALYSQRVEFQHSLLIKENPKFKFLLKNNLHYGSDSEFNIQEFEIKDSF